MRLTAYFRDATGRQAQGELLLLSQFSPLNHHIKVVTSTQEAKVCKPINANTLNYSAILIMYCLIHFRWANI